MLEVWKEIFLEPSKCGLLLLAAYRALGGGGLVGFPEALMGFDGLSWASGAF